MPRPRRSIQCASVLLLLLLAMAGCASSGTSDGGTRPTRDPNRLTTADMEDSAQLDLLSVIQQKRPRWLSQRTPATFSSSTLVAVVLDGIRQMGSAEVLRNIPASTVESARYLSASDATTQFGTDMAGGAIVVQTKR